ncbi:MAG: geranylgeranyl reductase family protein [Nitrospirota bacterium]
MLRTKVLIIGGGPAGATAAKFLAGSGVDTVLVERDLSYKKPCGGGIPSSAFDELDIPRDAVTNEISTVRIVSPRGETVDVELKGGWICIAERGVLDRSLRDQAGQKGAHIIEGAFDRFETVGTPIVSLVRRRQDGRELAIASDYVIASDGITSRVAAAAGALKQDFLYTISARVVPSQGKVCEFWFGEEHAANFYSWVFPSRGYASVGTGSSTPRGLTTLLDAFVRRRYSDSLQSLAGKGVLEKTRAFRIPVWKGTPFSINNILFAGDAAGAVMPVTYEGIYYAMKSGEFAARALIERNPAAYGKLWNSRFRARFLFMNRVRKHLFKSNATIEKWVALHKNADIQELAVKLWLHKRKDKNPLVSYMNVFKHLIAG